MINGIDDDVLKGTDVGDAERLLDGAVRHDLLVAVAHERRERELLELRELLGRQRGRARRQGRGDVAAAAVRKEAQLGLQLGALLHRRDVEQLAKDVEPVCLVRRLQHALELGAVARRRCALAKAVQHVLCCKFGLKRRHSERRKTQRGSQLGQSVLLLKKSCANSKKVGD